MLGTALLAAGQFLLALLWDLLVSSIEVTRLVLQKEIPLRQGIIALPSGSDSRLVTLLSAQAITLTPGEMVVEMDEDGVMYTHSLDVVVAAEREPAAQKRRVQLLERIV
jgi:multicomponent Na+:H+ antiporter subunit E